MGFRHLGRPRSSVHETTPALISVALETPLGAAAAAWKAGIEGGPNLLRLTFGYNTREIAWATLIRDLVIDGRDLDRMEELDEEDLPAQARRLVTKIRRYAEGKKIDFTDVAVDASHLRGFARKVHEACRRVPYGETLSYSELAARAGSPRAARAVGSVMRECRTGLVVPCHRILAAGGKIGGYGSPAGIELKRRLLALESRL